MTFELFTRYTSATYHARYGALKATCTCGHEWAAKALVTKILDNVVVTGRMADPTVVSLKKISESSDHTAPVSWRLTLREVN